MKSQFNHILDITGVERIFPFDISDYVLFFTADRRFFIYALYTKENLSTPDFFEITLDSFIELQKAGSIEIFTETIDEIEEILADMIRKTLLENTTVEQVLNLTDK